MPREYWGNSSAKFRRVLGAAVASSLRSRVQPTCCLPAAKLHPQHQPKHQHHELVMIGHSAGYVRAEAYRLHNALPECCGAAKLNYRFKDPKAPSMHIANVDPLRCVRVAHTRCAYPFLVMSASSKPLVALAYRRRGAAHRVDASCSPIVATSAPSTRTTEPADPNAKSADPRLHAQNEHGARVEIQHTPIFSTLFLIFPSLVAAIDARIRHLHHRGSIGSWLDNDRWRSRVTVRLQALSARSSCAAGAGTDHLSPSVRYPRYLHPLTALTRLLRLAIPAIVSLHRVRVCGARAAPFIGIFSHIIAREDASKSRPRPS